MHLSEHCWSDETAGNLKDFIKSWDAGWLLLWSPSTKAYWVPNLDPLSCREDVAPSGVTNSWCWDFCIQEKMVWRIGQGLWVLLSFYFHNMCLNESLDMSWKGREAVSGNCRACEEKNIVLKAWSGEYPNKTAIINLHGINNWCE